RRSRLDERDRGQRQACEAGQAQRRRHDHARLDRGGVQPAQSVLFDSAAVDEVLLVLKIAFLVLLYLFIWRIVRTASRDLRLPQESFILAPTGGQAGIQPARRGPVTGRLVVVKSADLDEGQDFELDSAQLTIGRGG